MNHVIQHAINGLWIAALVVWVVGALTAKRTVRRQPFGSRLVQVVFFGLTFLLLWDHKLHSGLLVRRFVPPSGAAGFTGLVLTAVGVGVAIWARFYLGGNWSGAVTVKENHTLIRSGPYSVVRHPIYAGLELAILGTGIAIGELRGLAAAGAALIGMKLKSLLEERFMTEQFGAEYEQYKKKVKGIIPFVW